MGKTRGDGLRSNDCSMPGEPIFVARARARRISQEGFFMKAQTRIGLKHSIWGLFLSALAAFIVVFAIRNYAGPVPPLLVPGAVAFAVYVVMNRRLWQSTKESYDAGEVGRRVNQTTANKNANPDDTHRSTWFANNESDPSAAANHVSMRKKKALQTARPEGLS